MRTKTFDCVEMKRKGAEKVLAEIKGLKPDQELAYWQRATRELLRRQQSMRLGPYFAPET